MGNSEYAKQVESLKSERERILVELDRLRELLKTEVDPDADEGDPDLVEREKAVALVKTLERKQSSIEHALARTEQGLYGICERCGKPINPARLEAKPEATLCINCMAIVERQFRVQAAGNSF